MLSDIGTLLSTPTSWVLRTHGAEEGKQRDEAYKELDGL